MGAPDILGHLAAVGVRLTRHGDRLIAVPKKAVTPDVIELIRTHKPELLAALATDVMPDPEAEARLQRLLAMLKANPSARYAVLTDMQTDPEAVILALAIRGQATCEFRIPRKKWDGVLFLEMLERHTVH